MLVGSLRPYGQMAVLAGSAFPTGIKAARLMCTVAMSLPERTKRRCASPAMWHSTFALNLDGQQFMYNIPLMKSHAFFLCDLKNFFPLLLFKV